MVSQFDSLLKEGGSVNLSNFYVVKNNAPYKVANHPFKITFHKKTKVKAIQSVLASNVIGHVSAVGDVVHGERKGKKNRRMVVELTDIEIRQCFKHLFSSRFFIDEEIPEIDDFRTRLLARVGDDTSSLQPCACVTLATITSIEYEEGWVYLACCECNCKAVPNEDESSSKKSGKRKIRNTYKCEICGPDVVDVIPKFRVQVRVNDDSACASFLMFDRDVFNIVDRSAYALKEEEATKPNAPEYPDDLNKLIGKTFLFRVDVSRYNLINNYVVYTVGRMTSSELHIKSFIKLYADEMDEVKDVNEDGYETYGDNEEPIIETTQNPKPDTSTSSKDVESSIAENVVKVEPVEFNATPPQGKRVIAEVDKDKGAPSVTSRNKKKAVFSRRDK
ncbi:replication protein A 70 kDa DNA-binding subunit B [Tanacetum coccineum]